MLCVPMDNHSLSFVASMTVCPSDIRKIRQHVTIAEPSIDPLQNILVTPLFVNDDALAMAQELSEMGSQVYFDSGGYHVQIGKLRYEELYMPLLEAYKANRWAHVYTLPDHVPLSQDPPEVVNQKVRDTINYSAHFFQELPDELKPRAMPVVQGHTFKHIDACLSAYFELGVQRIGFGSFGTMGPNNEVNIATQTAIKLAKYVIDVAHAHNVKVHLFGVGAPALTAMLKGIRADSFDSAGWLKAAGYGMVALPLMRYWNLTHRIETSELQQGILPEDFEAYKKITGHNCRLCESIPELQAHKMYRAVHNLIVSAESVDLVNSGANERIQFIYQNGSPKYRTEYEKWLQVD